MHRVALAAAVALLAACGSDDSAAVSVLCTEGAATVAEALRAAPGEVTLEDGTRLSACVGDATSDAELQNVGFALTGAAEQLEVRAPSDPRAALELGYLVGAARRGAGEEGAIQAELVRRLERSAALVDASETSRRELRRGLAAGEERG